MTTPQTVEMPPRVFQQSQNLMKLLLVLLLQICIGVAGSDTLPPTNGSLESAPAFQTKSHNMIVALEESSTLPSGTASIHQPFDEVLRAYVADGTVSYAGFARDARFKDYLNQLQPKPVDLAKREDQLAYWINAYNALAIKGILDGKSPGSLIGRYRYFKATKYEVGGQEINLYDLERDILIPLDEPRIHFAIVCASASCPKLLSEAYTADKLEHQLDSNTRAFINDPSRNRFDREKKTAYLSKIFDWFEEDFEKHSGSVQRYLARYVNDSELANELQQDRYKIKHLKYDWSLNGSAPGS